MGPPEQASPEVTERSRELRDMMLAIKDQVVDLQGQHEMASRQINTAAEEHGRLNHQYVRSASSGLHCSALILLTSQIASTERCAAQAGRTVPRPG
jgi:hypothetical protein